MSISSSVWSSVYSHWIWFKINWFKFKFKSVVKKIPFNHFSHKSTFFNLTLINILLHSGFIFLKGHSVDWNAMLYLKFFSLYLKLVLHLCQKPNDLVVLCTSANWNRYCWSYPLLNWLLMDIWELFSLHYLYFTQQCILFDFKVFLFLPFSFKYTILKWNENAYFSRKYFKYKQAFWKESSQYLNQNLDQYEKF